MIGAYEAKQPSVGIFWVVQRSARETRCLSTGCSLEAAEPYGDFLTFPDGHYNVWEGWRTLRDPDTALRALVLSDFRRRALRSLGGLAEYQRS